MLPCLIHIVAVMNFLTDCLSISPRQRGLYVFDIQLFGQNTQGIKLKREWAYKMDSLQWSGFLKMFWGAGKVEFKMMKGIKQ